MRTYKTSEVASVVGLHPNSVRLYEEWGFIPKPERKENGYRVYTEVHIEQIRLARTALKCEIVQGGIRKRAIDIIFVSAAGDYDRAIGQTEAYIRAIADATCRAEEALDIVNRLISQPNQSRKPVQLTRKQTAVLLGVTIDTLRNWELNGLFTAKRKENGYRVYNEADIRRLKIIYALRAANYSLTAILRMLGDLDTSRHLDLKASIDVPKETEHIISACDRLLTSLKEVAQDAQCILSKLYEMKRKFT